MKKYLLLLFTVSTLCAISNAGLITHNDYTAGSVITAAGQNTNENTIVNEFNGNIDNTNIKTGGITTTNIANNTITDTNIAANTITEQRLATNFSYTKLFFYRRPSLVYSSGTTVGIETGIDGVSGQAFVIFPDTSTRSDSTSSHILCDVTRKAAWGSVMQSGINPSESLSANTWLHFYVVKSTNTSNTTDMVLVGTIVTPTIANFATLNNTFGTNGWVYLGTLPYGDNSAATTSIPSFRMAGNRVLLTNRATGNALSTNHGIRLATTAGALTITWSYSSANNSIPNLPVNILIGDILFAAQATSNNQNFSDSSGNQVYFEVTPGANSGLVYLGANIPLEFGAKITTSVGNEAMDINLTGYVDSVLGLGANGLL